MRPQERRASTSARRICAASTQRTSERHPAAAAVWSQLPPGVWALAAIAGIVLLANLPYLTGFSHWNPLHTNSGLLSKSTLGFLPGIPTIDPNIGYTTHALGHRAAVDWLSGRIPWWNPYEGLGAPLAGGMQSAAFFPLTLLLALPSGLLYFHLILEVVGGLGAWFFLRRLGLRNWLAVVGGAAFALNGTFAWFAHAPVNPIPFLPWLLAGVELTYAAAKRGERGGWGLIAVSLALSIYAGFPETAFVNGVLAAVWSVMRLISLERRDRLSFTVRIAKGLGVGLLVAAPITVAFVTYLRDAAIGGHSGILGRSHLPPRDFAAALMPYVFGPINAFSRVTFSRTLTVSWGQVGGYVTCSLLLLAALGLLARRRKGERLVLGGWAVFAVMTTYGIPVNIAYGLSFLPGFRQTAFFRYSPPSWELAFVVLAVIGLDALVYDSPARRRVFAAAGLCVVLVLIAVWFAWPVIQNIAPRDEVDSFMRASIAWGMASIAAIVAAAILMSKRVAAVLVAAVLLVDILVMFAVPQFSARRDVSADFAPVTFLRRNLGLSRFFTLGPIEPNYGSYWGLASMNVNDLPVPRAWTRHAHKLDPYAQASGFTGTDHGRPRGAPLATEQLLSNISAYRESGVRYVLTRPSRPLAEDAALIPVFESRTARIYEVDGAADYFSADPARCSVVPLSRERAVATCRRPAIIIRRELHMQGWQASVDGRPTPIRPVDEFQAVDLLPGRNVVTYRFVPPGMGFAVLAMAMGLTFLVAPACAALYRRLRVRVRMLSTGSP